MDNSSHRPAPQAISTHTTKLSNEEKGDVVTGLLTKLAYARQAVIDPNVLDYFASELEGYELVDVTTAIEAVIARRRAEGETAFPELAVLTDAVKVEQRRRKERERNASLRLPDHIQKLVDEDRESSRKLEAGETDGIAVRELVDGAQMPRLGAKTAPVAQVAPEPAVCPHCGPASPQDAAGCRRLAAYYTERADRLAEREAAENPVA